VNGTWRTNCEYLLAHTSCPLGLYEVPVPYHRLLSPELLGWLATTDRFVFHKDTSRRNDLIADKIAALPPVTTLKWFNGNCTTLLYSLKCGASGFSGVSANFYPFLLVEMVRRFKSSDTQELPKLQDFLTLAEGIVKQNYPSSAKAFVKLQLHVPVASWFCRSGASWPGSVPEEHMKHDALYRSLERICREMGFRIVSGPGLEDPNPTIGLGMVATKAPGFSYA